jgi:hypothetical protein
MKMRAGIVTALAGALLGAVAHAHVGSPNVFYQGDAGPYPVRVVVRPPGVVPGLAEISVRIADEHAGSVRRVAALPVYWNAGRKGSPSPDVAVPVRGQPNLFSTTLWLMKAGAYSVDVLVEGERGEGRVVVPVNSVATSERAMPPWFGTMLSALGLLLFGGAVRIVGATFGEAVVDPQRALARSDILRGRVAMAIAAPAFLLLLAGGKSWWDREDANYRNNRLFKPLPVAAEVFDESDQNILRIAVETPVEQHHRRPTWPPLIPDHGKIMHLFLVREPGLDSFAHLHPVPRSRTLFDVALPPLPAGKYRLYADVTHENGFSQTLVADAQLPEPAKTSAARDGVPAFLEPDPDDSWQIGAEKVPFAKTESAEQKVTCPLDNGCTMVWEIDRPLQANREAPLRFKVVDATGANVPLDLYMGMLAHAAVRHIDGSVFAHLHPVGTISMASQQFFSASLNEGNDSGNAAAHHVHHADAAVIPEHGISFPYEFPKAGRVRIWVQVKIHDRVMTGVFDADVTDASR